MRRPLLLLFALASACHRGRSSGEEQPAPAASVITLGVSVGTCPDVPACARECEAGSADRCRRLAATFAFGQGVGKDEARAATLFEHACDMRDPSACVFAGQMHEFARGVEKDDARAARFYERSCNLDWAPGCYNLAIMYERGTGVPPDRVRAGDLYQRACTAGAQSSCEKARQMHTAPFLVEGGLP